MRSKTKFMKYKKLKNKSLINIHTSSLVNFFHNLNVLT